MIDNDFDFNSPNRSIKARVMVYDIFEEYVETFTADDAIISITINREAVQGKFFGFGITQKLTLELMDRERQINYLEKECLLNVYLNAGEGFYSPFPDFYVSEIKRDENTNNLTITAYDALGSNSANTTVDNLMNAKPITMRDYAQLAAENVYTYGFVAPDDEYTNSILDREYPNGANYNGNETMRAVLDDIAEATQTIYYVDGVDNKVRFKRLDRDGEPVLIIEKDAYFTLERNEPITLTKIVSATELGDNVGSGSGDGATQYVRSNAFWDIQDDIAELVDGAVDCISDLTITPFNLDWRGNYYLELGDKIAIAAKDDSEIITYILSDTLIYNGGLSQTTNWSYEETSETASNPTTLGEALSQTFAKVDKAAKQVQIVVSDVKQNSQSITSLELTTGGISADVAELDAAVNATMTSEDVRLEIKRELAENGVDKVITATGFAFDESGLTVSKSGTEMTTLISEDGMTVNKNGAEMLKADNTGVVAKNLHAITYLIVGENSRFENYGSDRTGCFWIGG